MSGYRLYFLDDDDRIRDVAEFECDGDDEALSHADARCDGRAMELWSGARVVGRIAKRPLRPDARPTPADRG
jgi:hypothetical protein